MPGGGGAAPGARGDPARDRAVAALRGPAADRLSRRRRAGADGGRVGERAAGEPAGASGRRLREEARRFGRGPRDPGRLPRRHGAREGSSRRPARGDRPDRPGALVHEVDAVGRERDPLRPPRAMGAREARRGNGPRADVVRPSLHARPGRDRTRRGVRAGPSGGGRRAGRGRTAAVDRRAARRNRRLARPRRQARRGRASRRAAARAREPLRRALPPAPRAGDRDDDAVAPALLPDRGKPFRGRRQRRRAGRRPGGAHAGDRGAPRRRELHVRARRRRRHRRARRPARLDHLLRRRRLVRGEDRPCAEPRRAARRR